MVRIPYHLDLGEGIVLSLRWVNSDLQNVLREEQRRRASITEPLLEYRSRVEYVAELDLHCLYEATLHPPDDSQWDELNSLPSQEQILADTVVDAFFQIESECEADGEPLRWYKPPEVDGILRFINETQFRQSIPDVGGQLLSNFITTHPLPNANHRTAISFLETYLQTYDSDFRMPRTGVTGEWKPWAEEFVQMSKSLMTLGRWGQLLRILADCGCEEVARKGGHIIRLPDYDLDVSNSFEVYAGKEHLVQSRGFVFGVLENTKSSQLIGVRDDGKAALIDRLAASGQIDLRSSSHSSESDG